MSNFEDITVTCYACQGSSGRVECFIKQPHLWRETKHLCITCYQFRNKFDAKAVFNLAIILAVICTLLVSMHILDPGKLFLLILVIYLVAFLAILLHEGGHAIAALSVGMRVKAIKLGYSFKTKFHKLGGTYYSVGVLPDGGMVVPVFTRNGNSRRKLLCLFVAGPLANLIGAAAGWLALNVYEFTGVTGLAVKVWIGLNVIYFVFNLVARKTVIAKGFVVSTDGAMIRDLITKSDDELESLFASFVSNEAGFEYFFGDKEKSLVLAEKAYAAGDDSTGIKGLLTAVHLDIGSIQRAIEIGRTVLDSDAAPSYGRTLLINNLAYGLFMSGLPSELQEADQLSAEALLDAPMLLSIISTRGSILIELGRYQEGLVLLEDERFVIEREQNQASVLAMRAKAYASLGDIAHAGKMLEQARSLASECVVLDRVEAELALS